MTNQKAKCALCRKYRNLTYEHIPPKAAFNYLPAKPVSGDKMLGNNERMPWDTDGLQYSNQQKGMGKFSLCRECNNTTGAWYGNSYVEFAHIVHNILGHNIPDNCNGFRIPEMFPLRFIKQVLSMFCSINNFNDKRMETLRELVLQKEKRGLDKNKYKVCMYFTRSILTKYAPFSVSLYTSETGCVSIASSEITAYPLGFVLYFDPKPTYKYDGMDITYFANYTYDDCMNIEMPLCIKEVNSFLPLDYRTKKEIENCIKKNNLDDK